MQQYLYIGQIIVSALLITMIVLQNKGASIGGLFGGGGEGNVYRTKRGAEKILSISTVVLAIIFMGLGLVNILVY
ncbi:MAG: preprotein translocase subunit SecG [Patescibacteria group bacterium]